MGFVGALIWGVAALIVVVTAFRILGIDEKNVNEVFKIN